MHEDFDGEMSSFDWNLGVCGGIGISDMSEVGP